MKKNKLVLTKILAIGGTLLVWLPILAPIFFSLPGLIRAGFFRLDYLMPAELFPLVLAGGGLLVWAALRRRRYLKLIGWGVGGAAGLLALVDVLAQVTGLASGATSPGGWQWALVLGTLVAYILAVLATGIGGVLLLRELFKPAGS